MRVAHRRWGADAETMAGLEKLGSPSTRVVITGQQPGLLAGPLYTIYKALGAAALARSLAERHRDLNFVPVFWCASEDHDFDEIRRVYWPGSGGQLEEVLYSHPDWVEGRMIGTLKCRSLAETLVNRARNSTHDTEFSKSVLEGIAEDCDAGRTLEDAFCRTLLGLLSGSGLVIVSPLMDWVRSRGAPIMEREARQAGRSTEALLAREQELQNAGIDATLHRHPDTVNLFWIDAQERRHPLRRDAGQIVSLHPEREDPENDGVGLGRLEPDRLADRILREPASFSYNVVTRPMTQDWIFPTVAHLVGPGEASYLAQVEAVYDQFDVFAPVRYPRPQVVLTPNSVARTLKKYDLSLDEALDADASTLVRQVLERDSNSGVVRQLDELRRRHQVELGSLEDAAPPDPSIETAFSKLSQAMEKGFGMIKERILYSRERDEVHLTQAMTRVVNNLNPTGKPQERALNPMIPFAIQYGEDWVMRLGAKLNYDPTLGTQTIFLSDLND